MRLNFPDMRSLKELDEKHFKQVKKRMNKLLNRLLNDDGGSEKKVYFEEYKSKERADKFIRKLEKKKSKFWKKQPIKLVELNSEGRKVAFKSGKAEIFSSDINLKYFRIFVTVGEQRDCYVYFEQMRKKGITCFLMNENYYEGNSKKKEFGSNIETWKNMRLQMKMWNQIFDAEEISKSVPSKIEIMLGATDYISFLKPLIENYKEFSQERQDISAEAGGNFVPYVTKNKRHGMTIVYAKKKFEEIVAERFNEGEREQFYSWLRENSLVVVDSEGNVDAPARGKGSSEARCYTFIMEKVEKMIF